MALALCQSRGVPDPWPEFGHSPANHVPEPRGAVMGLGVLELLTVGYAEMRTARVAPVLGDVRRSRRSGDGHKRDFLPVGRPRF
jgi:hypothetical protein